MRAYQKTEDVNRSFSGTTLAVVLSLVAIFVGVVVAKGGEEGGVLLLGGLIGATVVVLSFLYPVIGYYLVIVIGFLFADVKRLLKLELPIGTVIDFLIILTFLAIIIGKTLRREKIWTNFGHPIIYAYLVIIFYALFQIFNPNGGSMAGNLLILRRFVALQMFLACSVILFNDANKVSTFFKFWFGFSVIAGLYAVQQQFMGYAAYELNFINSDPKLIALYSSDNGGGFRKFSFLPDPTTFGILMAATAVIYLVIFLNLKNRLLAKVGLIAGVIFMLLGMSFSGTRTATFSFCVGIALYIMMTLSNPRTLIFAAFSLLAFVVLIYGPIYGNPTINRLRSTFELSDDASFNVRDVNRHSIQPYLHSHPIGGGLGTTGGSAGELDIDRGSSHPLAGFPTDSGFLKMGLEYGWIGLIIQCIAFFIVLQQGVKAYFRSKVRRHRMFLLASVIGVFCYVMSHYAQVSIGTIPGTFLFYALIAVIIRLPQIESSNQNQPALKPVL